MRAVRALSVAVACWSVALPAAAFTISLTVSGTTHDVLFTAGSYDSVNGDPATPLTTTPWFGGGFGAAADFALELQTADLGGAVGLPDDSAYYVFAYTGLFEGATYAGTTAPLDAGNVFNLAGASSASDFLGSDIYFASVAAPAAVPEIDGNALAKALFILFALGAWLEARRRRAV